MLLPYFGLAVADILLYLGTYKTCMQLTITGYSTALFSTWYFIDEFGLLFDAGDGMVASLLQKSRRVNHAFITHADRDHLTGLLQFNQLNARPGFPLIYYPANCGSFPAFENFARQFDPQSKGSQWLPLLPDEEIWLRNDILVRAIKNGHVPSPEGIFKSCGYKLIQVRKKMKPEFAGCSGAELQRLVEEHGNAFINNEVRTTLLGYSGDTPVEDYDRWNNCEVLIHEATFLDEKLSGPERANKHSRLHEVMEMVSQLNVGKLVLGHFSSRYHPDEIDAAIKNLCEKFAINIPVYRVLPGQTVNNILGQVPVNR